MLKKNTFKFFFVFVVSLSILGFWCLPRAANAAQKVRVVWQVEEADRASIQTFYILRKEKNESTWTDISGPLPNSYYYFIDDTISATGVYEYKISIKKEGGDTIELESPGESPPAAGADCASGDCVINIGSTVPNVCAVGDWEVGVWGVCSRTCGGGAQARTVTKKSGSACTGEGGKPTETQSCNNDPCTVCTPKICADPSFNLAEFCGSKSLSNGCGGNISCGGILSCPDGCNAANNLCKVNGGWSDWSAWTPTCSLKYIIGESQTHTRVCDSPAPANGGANCAGSGAGSRDCKDFYPILKSFKINNVIYNNGAGIVNTTDTKAGIAWELESAAGVTVDKVKIWKAVKSAGCDRGGAGLEGCSWNLADTVTVTGGALSGEKDVNLTLGEYYIGIHAIGADSKYITEEQATTDRNQKYGPIEVKVTAACVPKICADFDLTGFCGSKSFDNSCGGTINCGETLSCPDSNGACGEPQCVSNACTNTGNAEPADYGQNCNPNNCNQFGGTISCGGSCSGAKPADVLLNNCHKCNNVDECTDVPATCTTLNPACVAPPDKNLQTDPEHCGAPHHSCFNNCGAFKNKNICVSGVCEICATTCATSDDCDLGAADCIFAAGGANKICVLKADAPKVSGFSVAPLTSVNSFTISWTITAQEEIKVGHFELWRRPAGGAWAKIGADIATETRQINNDPVAEGVYEYGLHMVNAAGAAYGTEMTSGLNSVTATKLNDQPAIINFAVSPAQSDSSFSVSWSMDAGEEGKASHFEVWRSDDNGSTWAKIGSDLAKNLRSASDNPNSFGDKKYGLRVVKNDGTKWWSETDFGLAIVSVKKIYGKPKISSFSVAPLQSASNFTVSWTITAEELAKTGHFELWRSGDNKATWQKAGGNIAASAANVTDEPVVVGDYWYGLHIVNKDGSDYGTEVTSGLNHIEVNKSIVVSPIFLAREETRSFQKSCKPLNNNCGKFCPDCSISDCVSDSTITTACTCKDCAVPYPGAPILRSSQPIPSGGGKNMNQFFQQDTSFPQYPAMASLMACDLNNDGYPEVSLAGRLFTYNKSSNSWIEIFRKYALDDTNADQKIIKDYTENPANPYGFLTRHLYDYGAKPGITKPKASESNGFPQFMVCVDFDGDGLKDLIGANVYNTPYLFIMRNNGNLDFSDGSYKLMLLRVSDLFMGHANIAIKSINAADLDLDGMPDLIISGEGLIGGRGIVFFLSTNYWGNINQNDVLKLPDIEDAGRLHAVEMVFPADIDEDGDIDLFLGNYSGGGQFWLNQLKESGKVKFLRARAGDNYYVPIHNNVPYEGYYGAWLGHPDYRHFSGRYIEGIVMEDFDQDGRRDLLLANQHTMPASFKLKSDKKFEQVTPESNPFGFNFGVETADTNPNTEGFCLLKADLLNDGVPDIVQCVEDGEGVFNSNTHYFVEVLGGNKKFYGNMLYGPSRDFIGSSNSIIKLDANNDGLTDLLASASGAWFCERMAMSGAYWHQNGSYPPVDCTSLYHDNKNKASLWIHKNETPYNKYPWAKIRLFAAADGVGSKLEFLDKNNGVVYTEWADSPMVEFGSHQSELLISNSGSFRKVKITWPGGSQSVHNIKQSQLNCYVIPGQPQWESAKNNVDLCK